MSAPTGRFSHDVKAGTWTWDDEVFRIHGLAPQALTPTTELVLASKHPDDRDRIRRLLEAVTRTGESFSVSYRLVGADGIERRVVLVGQGVSANGAGPCLVEGYYVDLTSDFDAESEEHAQRAVAASAESRAEIEQAKGVLMLAYALTPEQAFAMLQWWSRNRNIKVRELARRLVALVREGKATDAELRSGLDAALHDVTLQPH